MSNKVKIAINGFGRIGRLALRRAYEDGGFEVVAINDLTSPKELAYLLKYDSAHGTFNHEVSCTETAIVVDGREIPVIGNPDPSKLEWAKYGAEIVLECTGRLKGAKDAVIHVTAGGAKGVIISAPSDKETPTFV